MNSFGAIQRMLVVLACSASALALPASAWARATAPTARGTSIAPPPDLTLSWSSTERQLCAEVVGADVPVGWLFSAALAAGGVSEPARLQEYQRRLNAWLDELRPEIAEKGDDRARAEAIFDFMHRRILVGQYQVDQTDIHVALDSGDFNCVSSAVLFQALAERLGLRAQAVQVAGHAFCELLIPEGSLDIETTCPSWFRALGNTQRQRELVERTTGSRRHDNSAAARRRLAAPELVALIYYNHGVANLRNREFDAAVTANLKALRLDPASAGARGNVLAALNNWAIWLGARQEFAAAVGLLLHGARQAPEHAPFRVNLVAVHQQWIDALTRQRRFADALERLDQAASAGIDHEYVALASLDLCRKWGQELAMQGRLDDALELIARRRQMTPDPGWNDVIVLVVNHRGLALISAASYQAAVDAYDRGLAVAPHSDLLTQNRRSAVMHWAAQAFASGDYPEAIRRTTYRAQPGKLATPLQQNVRYGYYRWKARLEQAGRWDEAASVAQQAQRDPFLQ